MRASSGLLCIFFALSAVKSADPLPDTKPLTEEGNLSAKQVAGMHQYLDRMLAYAPKERAKLCEVDKSSPEAYAKSVEPHRAGIKKMLGLVDARVSPRMEHLGGPDEQSVVADCDAFTVYAVRWAVLPGVDGEGLLLEPKVKLRANVVAIPDATWSPEQIVGFAADGKGPQPFARRLAEQGCRVVVPVLIDRNDSLSRNDKLNRATNLPHREFVHRMAYEMGRTLVGYETQKVLAVMDWFLARDKAVPVGVIGVGDGGRIALYAAAIDKRIRGVAVSCAFGPREEVHDEPLDRNLWTELREFGDAELLALIQPRGFTIAPPPNDADHVKGAHGPEWGGPTKARGGAAPGTLKGVNSTAVTAEWNRFGRNYELHNTIFKKQKWDDEYGWSYLLGDLSEIRERLNAPAKQPLTDTRKHFDPVARHKRQFDQLVAYTQKLWRHSDATRKAFWAKADASSPEAWEKSCEWYRDYFHTEVIGKLPEPTIPLNPRTRQVYDEKTWTGYEVVLDVYQDVFAYGILLLPKDLKPGEKRPVVVCQHGLEGTPRDTIEVEKRTVYNQFSRRLVELGYIVYAPQNPYYGNNGFRQLQRKANPLKLSLFSFIIRQHQRTLDWLETLPNVDPERIAFYGLSYGGKTAMRVPAVEKRYCLSICSGDFNEWIGKNVSIDLDRSYMWTGEYEMYEFDLGNTFNYAEMAYLIAPRPFMVERGHDDGVGTDEMVAYEYARVRYLYAIRLKIPDRTAIEFFVGGHQINGKGTFAFLKDRLEFPK
jgi:dienelactone hydrolase